MAEAITLKRQPFLKILDRLKRREKDQASEKGKDRADLKEFLESTPGLHNKALSDIRRIDKMEAHKRDDYFRSFDLLREVLEEERWSDGQGDLLDRPDPPEVTTDEIVGFGEDEDDVRDFDIEDGEAASNVTQMAAE